MSEIKSAKQYGLQSRGSPISWGPEKLGITSREDDWQVADAANLIGELAAGHMGHRVVCYHEVDR